ncbi:MAG TPA: efflux RND transporter periplasmic adaptor subunit [Verrucomicrobiae bacterium]
MKRKFKFITGSALVLAALGTVALATTNNSKSAAPTAAPTPRVTVSPVEEREIVEEQEFTGHIEAVDSVAIRPRVSGYITKIHFASGQHVKKGDLLISIDSRPFDAALKRAQGELAQAQADLDLAKREAVRARALLANNAISREEADRSLTREAQTHAAVDVAEAAVITASLNVEWAQVRSPIDGVVSRAYVTEGNNVSGVDGSATVLTSVVSVDPVYLTADIDEHTLLRVNDLRHQGNLATDAEGHIAISAGLADETGFPHAGFVESLDNQVNPATGSLRLRAQLANPDEKFVPGLYARIHVPVSARKPVLLINEASIGTDQDQKYVLTLTASNTVAYRTIQLGGVVDGRRIVLNGLTAGEPVVVEGLQHVRPGAAVTAETQVAAQPVHGQLAKR